MTLDPRRQRLWTAMGLGPVWQARTPSTPDAAADEPRADRIARLDWDALVTEVAQCRACPLGETRRQAVFGVGHRHAEWMLVGEAPGAEEDARGEPFVGQAGKLLTELLGGIGRTRADVYIANVVKCRPPMNRDPEDDEISSCMPFLRQQIEIISPEVIMSLGRISAHTLLGSTSPMSKFSITRERGKLSEYTVGERSIPLMPTFHPAYLLRNRSEKKATWQDAQAVLRLLGLAAGTTEAS